MIAAMRLALYEPDIPQNAGTLIRLATCLGVEVDVIEPCGFVWGGKHLRRAGMDYLERARVTRHDSPGRPFTPPRAPTGHGGSCC